MLTEGPTLPFLPYVVNRDTLEELEEDKDDAREGYPAHDGHG